MAGRCPIMLLANRARHSNTVTMEMSTGKRVLQFPEAVITSTKPMVY